MTQLNHPNSAARSASRTSSGFTVAEMMVVIAVIAILLAMSFPALNRIRGAVLQRNQAQNEVAAIATALRAYLSEYSVWPSTLWSDMGPEGLPVDQDVIHLLSGHEDMAAYNRRRITFMEFPARVLEGGEFLDPWWNRDEDEADHVYRFVVNLDFGNAIEVAPQGHDRVTVRQPVAVWTTGSPDNELIKSW